MSSNVLQTVSWIYSRQQYFCCCTVSPSKSLRTIAVRAALYHAPLPLHLGMNYRPIRIMSWMGKTTSYRCAKRVALQSPVRPRASPTYPRRPTLHCCTVVLSAVVTDARRILQNHPTKSSGVHPACHYGTACFNFIGSPFRSCPP